MKALLVAFLFSLPIMVFGQVNSTNTPTSVLDSIQVIEIDPQLLDCAHGHTCCQVGCPCCPGEMNHITYIDSQASAQT